MMARSSGCSHGKLVKARFVAEARVLCGHVEVYSGFNAHSSGWQAVQPGFLDARNVAMLVPRTGSSVSCMWEVVLH